MTCQQVIDRVRQIVQETDPTSTHASDSVIVGWINEAITQLCSTLLTLPKELITSVVAAATLDLSYTAISKDLLRIDYASMSDGAATPVWNDLQTIDFTNFCRIFGDWKNQPAGKPTHLVRMTSTSWMMWPTPDATWTGKALTIGGAVKPADITASDAIPLPVALHSCIPHYCAWLFFLLLNNPEKAAGNFATYDALRKLNTQTATSTVGSLSSFKIRGM